MVGFCHLTDSHHYHHGQKPTMVGICHGGNMPVGRNLYTLLELKNQCVEFPDGNRQAALLHHEGHLLVPSVLK